MKTEYAKKEFRTSDYIIPIILVFVIGIFSQSHTEIAPIVNCKHITIQCFAPVYNPYVFKILPLDTCFKLIKP